MQASTCNVDVYNVKLYAPLTHNARHLSTQTLKKPKHCDNSIGCNESFKSHKVYLVYPLHLLCLSHMGIFKATEHLVYTCICILCHILIFTVIANSC